MIDPVIWLHSLADKKSPQLKRPAAKTATIASDMFFIVVRLLIVSRWPLFFWIVYPL